MHWQGFFKGTYITGAEFGDRTLVATISRVESVDLEGEDGRVKPRAVVWFSDLDRGWVLCKTNAICVAAMFGDDVDGWVGKRVHLFSTEVNVGKDKKIGIRVKGSPDITRPVTATIKLPRKKPFTMVLQPSKNPNAGKPAAQAQQAPEPKPAPQPEPTPTPTPKASNGGSDAAALLDKLREW